MQREIRCLASLCAVLVFPACVLAQEITGTVASPAANRRARIIVTLLDSVGARVETTIADRNGGYRFKPASAGSYSLRFDVLGGPSAVSPAIPVEADQVMSYVHEWPAADSTTREPAQRAPGQPGIRPPQLARVTVTAQRERERFLGMDPRTFAIKPIGPDVIVPLGRQSPSFAVMLSQLRVPGMYLVGGHGTADGMCVVTPGTALRMQGLPCSRVFLDGLLLPSGTDLSIIDPQTVDRIIVLRASEATTFFGTGDGNGALLIFTRVGSR